MPRIELEICVDEPESVEAAVRGGADRLELCAALGVGGLTPGEGFVVLVRERSDLPLFAMVRPRAGGFVHDADERRVMLHDARRMRELGCDGLVFGALTQSGEVDLELVRALLDAAGGLPCTFHRAIDLVVDPFVALEELAELGIRRVLSSGGRTTALEGAERLAAMVERAPEGLTVMAGGGVRSKNARTLVDRTGVLALHASAAEPLPTSDRVLEGGGGFVDLRGGIPVRRRTSEDEVRTLRDAIDSI